MSDLNIGDLLINEGKFVDSRFDDGEIGIVINLKDHAYQDYSYVTVLWSSGSKGMYYVDGIANFKINNNSFHLDKHGC